MPLASENDATPLIAGAPGQSPGRSVTPNVSPSRVSFKMHGLPWVGFGVTFALGVTVLFGINALPVNASKLQEVDHGVQTPV